MQLLNRDFLQEALDLEQDMGNNLISRKKVEEEATSILAAVEAYIATIGRHQRVLGAQNKLRSILRKNKNEVVR